MIINSSYTIFTYRAFHFEDMAVVFGSFDVPRDVGKEPEIIRVLTGTKYVPYLMVTNHFLEEKKRGKFIVRNEERKSFEGS